MNTMKNCQDSWWPGWDLNKAPSQYKYRVSPLDQNVQCLIFCHEVLFWCAFNKIHIKLYVGVYICTWPYCPVQSVRGTYLPHNMFQHFPLQSEHSFLACSCWHANYFWCLIQIIISSWYSMVNNPRFIQYLFHCLKKFFMLWKLFFYREQWRMGVHQMVQVMWMLPRRRKSSNFWNEKITCYFSHFGLC